MMDECRPSWLQDLTRNALDEDLGVAPAATGNLQGVPPAGRDVTTAAIFDSAQRAQAVLVAREPSVVAGLQVIEFALADVQARFGLAQVAVELLAADGDLVEAGTELVRMEGPVRVLLTAERTILNILSRASGVATATRRWVDALAGTGARVLDTRKTMPTMRELDKYAVRAGGGTNKRMGLYDVAMIKDNHIAAAGSIERAISLVRAHQPDVDIQVEADTVEQALAAIDAGARFLLLDNMPVATMRQAVAAIRSEEQTTGRVELEATGGLTLANAREVALTGVDYLSVGALTHSSPIVDIGLDFVA
ncbi:carboxylating nicotinate-nucleotide diphosphorylase [Rarobacter incanus]|nr:carboxylating nicotinate-nucleotide diphosphorylase [Rarobacter incanus]